MRLLRIILWATLLVHLIDDAKASDWMCRSQSSITRGANSILTCGIGIADSENEARELAYTNALKEFKTTCDVSDDCRHNKVTARPKRTECEKTNTKHKCYRAVLFEITKEAKNLDEELERQERTLAYLRVEKAKRDNIASTELTLKFERPNPSYWNLGLGVVVSGTEFDVANSLQVGYGLNFKRCFKDTFCSTVGITVGKILLDDGEENGNFFNAYSGSSLYLYKQLYAVYTVGIESQWNATGSNVGPTATLGLGVDAIRVQNFSISIEGAAKSESNTPINGTFNVFWNFKF